jgi:hypothetical protein
MLHDSFKDGQSTEPMFHDWLKACCNAEAILRALLSAFRSTLCCTAQVVESLRHEIIQELICHYLLEDSYQVGPAAAGAAVEERWKKRNQPRNDPNSLFN